jgi:hypothetical protein
MAQTRGYYMPTLISKNDFALALSELGHNPADYAGKKLTLTGMAELYEVEEDSILGAVEAKLLSAHYDYSKDTIWVDALEAAHFYYCVKMENDLLNNYAA